MDKIDSKFTYEHFFIEGFLFLPCSHVHMQCMFDEVKIILFQINEMKNWAHIDNYSMVSI